MEAATETANATAYLPTYLRCKCEEKVYDISVNEGLLPIDYLLDRINKRDSRLCDAHGGEIRSTNLAYALVNDVFYIVDKNNKVTEVVACNQNHTPFTTITPEWVLKINLCPSHIKWMVDYHSNNIMWDYPRNCAIKYVRSALLNNEKFMNIIAHKLEVSIFDKNISIDLMLSDGDEEKLFNKLIKYKVKVTALTNKKECYIMLEGQ